MQFLLKSDNIQFGFSDLLFNSGDSQLFFSDLDFDLETLKLLFLFRCHLLRPLSTCPFRDWSQAKKTALGVVFSPEERQNRSKLIRTGCNFHKIKVIRLFSYFALPVVYLMAY